MEHQHKDKKGRVFGKKHPEDAQHTKKSTIRAHKRTIKMDKKETLHEMYKKRQ